MDDRRKHTRLTKQYRLEYGLFSAMINQDSLKEGIMLNLSGGGVLFCSDEPFTPGIHLFIKIHVYGWDDKNGAVEKVDNQSAVLILKTIAEVIRSDFDEYNKVYLVGAKFLGQLHS